MDLRLRGLGVEREKLPELAANALKTASWLKDHPKKLDKKAISAIYEEAW